VDVENWMLKLEGFGRTVQKKRCLLTFTLSAVQLHGWFQGGGLCLGCAILIHKEIRVVKNSSRVVCENKRNPLVKPHREKKKKKKKKKKKTPKKKLFL
jgi:hypothetical protein